MSFRLPRNARRHARQAPAPRMQRASGHKAAATLRRRTALLTIRLAHYDVRSGRRRWRAGARNNRCPPSNRAPRRLNSARFRIKAEVASRASWGASRASAREKSAIVGVGPKSPRHPRQIGVETLRRRRRNAAASLLGRRPSSSAASQRRRRFVPFRARRLLSPEDHGARTNRAGSASRR